MRPFYLNTMERVLLNAGREWDFTRYLDFANASSRYVVNPVTGAVTGPYASGVPAVINIGGRKYFSAWRALTNKISDSDDLTSWLENATITPGLPGPGSNSSCRMTANTTTEVPGGRRLLVVTPSGAMSVARSVFAKLGTQGTHCGFGFSPYSEIDPTANFVRYSSVKNYVSGTDYFVVRVTDAGGTAVIGDNLIFSIVQYEWDATYPGRPIPTSGTPITTAKDEAFLPAVSVPNIVKDKLILEAYPRWSSAQVTTGDLRFLCEFADTVQNIKVYYNGTDKKVYVYGAAALIASAATTHSAHQRLTITLDRADGSMVLSGFTTGNGTTVDTSWSSTDGNLYLGMDAALANQFDGLVHVRIAP